MNQRLNQLCYILLFGCVIALCISINKCSNNRTDYDQSKSYLTSLNDTITYLRSGVAQKKVVEVSPDLFKSIVAENEGLKKALKDANIKAKQVKSVTTIVTQTKIDTFAILLHDTIPIGDSHPIAFSVDSANYSIGGRISSKSIEFDHISFRDSLYAITAIKNHFFKKDEYIVSVKHSNPYIRTIGLTNLTVTDDKHWWQNGWIKFGVGIVAGSYLTYKLTQ